MGIIFLVVVVFLLVGGLPVWPHSQKWGYGPSSGIGLLLVVLVVLVFMGVIPRGF